MDLFQNHRIHVVSDANECRRLLQVLESHCEQFPVLGFDCEWTVRGKVRQPISLLQLVSNGGLCLLIRLCHMQTIPKELIDILETDKIVKVGVESKGDADLLFEDYSIRVQGTLDLRYLADLAYCVPSGLAKMSETYLNIKLNKKFWDIHNRWKSAKLTQKQIDYAAKDVQVAIELFKFFANKLQAETLPNQPFDIHHYIDKYCRLYLNTRYSRGAPPVNSNSCENTIDYHEI